MFDKSAFPFDPAKIAEMFKAPDFSKMMAGVQMPGIDPEALMTAQKKNMDALMEANKAAAAGYQDLFQKQMAIFEATMSEAQSLMGSFDGSNKTEAVSHAFEKAVSNMTELAEAARKANADAYQIIAARINEQLAEIRAMGSKA